ncbi:MAG: AHH domain-containing protein, partial [Cohaesibacter sp.]|nr:AHH domain-containing protein [Cohaesibacter sp.]
MTDFQKHHLIPNEVKDHPVLEALKNAGLYNQGGNDNLINLPTKATANQVHDMALAAPDSIAHPNSAHTGPHKAYTDMVRNILKGMQNEFFDEQGNLNPGKSAIDLNNEIKKLQFFLSDGLTASFDGKKVKPPEFILNNSDPNSPGFANQDAAYDKLYKKYGSYEQVKKQWAFENGLKLKEKIDFNKNLVPDDGAEGKSGLSAMVAKYKGAKEAGLSYYKDVDLSSWSISDLDGALNTNSRSKLNSVKGFKEFFNNESGAAGSVHTLMMGLVGLSLYKIASDSNVTIEQLLTEIDLDIPPEFLADATAGVTVMLAESAALGLITGGIGTLVRISYDAVDSIEMIQFTVQLLDIAYPEWQLMKTISAASDTVIDIAQLVLKNLAETSNFSQMIIVDTSEANSGNSNIMKVDGASGNELVWVRGEGEVHVNTKGGEDWIFHSGKGNINAGNGDDFIYAQNVSAGDQTYDQERLEMTIDAGSGDDWVLSRGAATIDLGQGKDVLLHSGIGSVIHTGPGGADDADKIFLSRGSLVTDADGYDSLYVNGHMNAAGLYTRGALSESPWAYGKGGMVRVGFNSEGALVVGDLLSVDGKDETFYYLANGSKDVQASSSELTAGIRTAQTETIVWQLMEGYPSIESAGKITVWELINKTIKDIDFRANAGGVDPLVLDLDGDGLELTALAGTSGPMFDMDGDHFKEYTGWVSPDDGLLALDVNDNGTIDYIAELFGGVGQSGFAALSTYDENLDGVIDASDSSFSDLRVWRDLDRDGETDEGELFTLSDLNITSLSLAASESDQKISLNNVARTGSFTYSDGSSGLIGDVEFRVNNYDTVYMGDTSVSDIVSQTMPNLKGRGTLTDLHVSLTLNEAEGTFASVVNRVLPTLNVLDLDVLSERAFEIFDAWMDGPPEAKDAGNSNPNVHALIERSESNLRVLDFALEITEDVVLDDGTSVSRTYWKMIGGTPIKDADGTVIQYPSKADLFAHVSDNSNAGWETVTSKELDFVERYFGEQVPFGDPDNLSASSISALGTFLETAERLTEQMSVRLAAQGGLKDYFVGVDYSVEEDIFVATSHEELIPMFKKIFSDAPDDEAGARSWLDSWKTILDTFLSDFKRSGSGLVTKPFIFTNVVAAYETIGLPISLSDAAESLGVPKEYVNYESGQRQGTSEGEIFYMSSGDDVIESKSGADVFVFGENFGQDVIKDYEAGHNYFDVIRFAHLSPDDITATRDGFDLVLTVDGTGDSVRVVGQFHKMGYALGGGANVMPDEGVEEIIFADGTVWSNIDIAMNVSHPTDAEDTVIGTDHVDYLDGGKGDDFLSGGDNSDIYIFGKGYGQDIFSEQVDTVNSPQDDFLYFNEDVKFEDLSFHRNGDSKDIEIRLASGDSVKIINQTDSIYSGIFDPMWHNRIEYFNFRSSAEAQYSFTHEDLMKFVIDSQSTDGNDMIYGFDYEDVLDGGAGDDYLNGGNDNDIYIFGLGYGNDTIYEYQTGYHLLSGQNDTVRFLEGVNKDNISVSVSADLMDLIFRLPDGSQLTIQDQFHASSLGNHLYQIEAFEFADNTRWTLADLEKELLFNSNENDTIIGFFYDDVLDGGAGNDFLNGRDGNDTYIFGYGYGHDTVLDEVKSVLSGETDTVKFKDVASVDELSLSRTDDGKDLTIGLSDGSTLLVKHAFNDSLYFYRVEQFQFSDGTILSNADIRNEMMRRQATDGHDLITGTKLGDVISGGKGNDIINGGSSSDTYVYARGDGDDVITEEAWSGNADKLVFSDIRPDEVVVYKRGSDLLLKINDSSAGANDAGSVRLNGSLEPGHEFGIETIEFSDGSIWTDEVFLSKVAAAIDDNQDIVGTDGSDILQGGAGDDDLNGKDGADIYHYTLGDGNDVIFDDQSASISSDQLQLHGIDPDAVSLLSGEDESLIMRMPDGGSVTLIRQLYSSVYGVEEIVFDDGTVWDRTQMVARYASDMSTDGNDVIAGSYLNDTLSGGSGDDTLFGEMSDDSLTGGLGNDSLYGYNGSDTFIYTLGDGKDTIFDRGTGQDDVDRLILHNVVPDDVGVSSTHDGNLALTMPDGAMIVINDQFNGRVSGLEEIVFDDGTIWQREDFDQSNVANQSTDDSDVIVGTQSDDRLEGGLGHDFLNGKWGDDTYVYSLGDGADIIEDDNWRQSELDKLILHGVNADEIGVDRNHENAMVIRMPDGGSIIFKNQFYSSGWGIEQVIFDDGTILSRLDLFNKYFQSMATDNGDVIKGSSEVDTLRGGLGDDELSGDKGGDTYIYSLGDGNDRIDEGYHSSSDVDRLVLRNISPDEVVFSIDANKALVLNMPDGGKITLSGQLRFASNGIEKIEFDDGTIWALDQIMEKYFSDVTTDGDDNVTGTYLDDTIEAGQGDDIVDGWEGEDTYIYNLGDGNDTIRDEVYSSADVDVLLLRGVSSDDVTVQHGSDYALLIKMPDGDVITVSQHFKETTGYGIEKIIFDDGTSWLRSDINQLVNTGSGITLAGSESDETLLGTDSDDGISGEGGSDILKGRAGSDTYFYSKGDGSDLIDDQNSSNAYTDILQFVDLRASDIELLSDGEDLKIVIASTGDSLTVADQFSSMKSHRGIEEIRFVDGTKMDRDAIFETILLIEGDGQENVLNGRAGRWDEELIGHKGDDTLNGAEGDDSYVYSLGDGNDVITDVDYNNSAVDKIVLHNITPADIVLSRGSNEALVITMPDGGSITIGEQFKYRYKGIEQIVFDDGTILDRTQILERYLSDSSSDGDDVIDGSYSSDIITGGLGNDTLDGGDGADSYVYSLGDGNDVITDKDYNNSAVDKIVLHNITPADIVLSHGSNEALVITMPDGGSITIGEQFKYRYKGIEQIVFDDGTILDRTQILERYLSDSSSDGDDVIDGSYSSDIIAGGLGNDTLDGGDGADSYVYSLGDGNDVITDKDYNTSNIDKIVLHNITPADIVLSHGSNDALVITMPDGGSVTIDDQFKDYQYGVEQIVFDDGTILDRTEILERYLSDSSSDGDDVIKGSSSSDIITGGLGDDTLAGGDGDDVYVYNLGDGRDVIRGEDYHYNETDKIILHGISPDDVVMSRNAGDTLVITMPDGGSITVNEQFKGDYYGIEQVEFDDGTVWSAADLEVNTSAAIDVNRAGTDLADILYGTSDNDGFDGRKGDDKLYGKQGSDIYHYANGDGSDFIDDEDGSKSSKDVLKFKDINAADIELSRDGEHLKIKIKATGEILTIDEQFYSDSRYYGLEEIQFADGDIWDRNKIKDEAWIRGTDASDVIHGTDDIDTIYGGKGDDQLYGKQGSDIYHYAKGDGSDFIDDEDGSTSSIDILKLNDLTVDDVELTRDGIHLKIKIKSTDEILTIDEQFYSSSSNYGIEQIVFSDGEILTRNDITMVVNTQLGSDQSETLVGSSLADILVGMEGDDILKGKDGSDIYRYYRGDGNDTIIDNYNEGTADTLLLEDINPADVSLVRNGDHVTLVISESAVGAGDGGSIYLKENLEDFYDRGVDKIVFAD